MLQVNKAYDYLVENAKVPERNLRFLINCGGGKRGVYLREARDVCKPSEVVITIEPMYLDNDSTSKLSVMCQIQILSTS